MTYEMFPSESVPCYFRPNWSVCSLSRRLNSTCIPHATKRGAQGTGYQQCNIWPWNSFRSRTFLEELFLFKPCIRTHIEMLQFNFRKIGLRVLRSMPFHLCNTENEKLLILMDISFYKQLKSFIRARCWLSTLKYWGKLNLAH